MKNHQIFQYSLFVYNNNDHNPEIENELLHDFEGNIPNNPCFVVDLYLNMGFQWASKPHNPVFHNSECNSCSLRSDDINKNFSLLGFLSYL